MRALAKAREDRFPTMAAFGRALERVGEDEPALAAAAPREPEAPLTASGGTVPVLLAARSLVGGTEHVLPRVGEDDEPPVSRRAAWPWLLAAGAAGVALLGWWLVEATPGQPRPESERVAAVDDGSDPQPSPATTATPHAEAEPPRATTEATTGPEPVAASGGSSSSSVDLTDRQIDATLRRMQPRVKTCAGPLTGGRHGDRVRVVLKVERASGRVASVDAKAPRNLSAVESCMHDVLLKARFDRVGGRGTQKIVRVLSL
jgi:hypothetical protein